MDRHLAWQAWHLWHWAGSGGAFIQSFPRHGTNWNHVSLRHPKVSTKILTIIGSYFTTPCHTTLPVKGRGLKTPNRTFCTLMVLRFQAGINWMDGSNPWAHFSNHAWNSYLHLFAFSYIVNLSSYSSSMDGWSCGWILSGAPSKIVQVFETKGVLLIWRQFFPLWVLVWISLGQLFVNLGHLTSNFPWRLDSFWVSGLSFPWLW